MSEASVTLAFWFLCKRIVKYKARVNATVVVLGSYTHDCYDFYYEPNIWYFIQQINLY